GAEGDRPLPGRVEVTLSKLPVARFGSLWPLALSPGGRRWALANIHDGMLDRATAQLDLKVDPARRALDVVAAYGSMRYHDLTVTYLPGLPPVQHVGGTATATRSELEFRPDTGIVKSLKLTGGTVKISDFAAPVETATVDLDVAGPLRAALEIIDAKKLRYAHAAGIDPAAVGGKAQVRLHFKFPLLAALKLDELDYAAKVRLTATSIAKIALGRDLSAGDFTVEIARNGLRATGGGRFDGLPVTVAATMSFHPKGGPLAVYRIGLRLDEAVRRRLGYDLAPDRLSGPVALDLTYTQRDPVRASASLVLDLRAARLAVPEANWSKPAGQPGSATIDFDLSHQHIAGPLRLAMRARGLDGHYTIALLPDRARVARVDITHLAIGNDDLAGAIVRRGGGWVAGISGRRLDLHPLLRHALSAESGSASPPLRISARFDQVVLGRGRVLRGVAAVLSRSGSGWQSMQIDGRFANGHVLSFRLGGALGPRRVGLTSNDLGATLRLFDVADNVAGGRLSVTGELTQAGGKPALRADISGANFSVVRAPVLTRILSLASYTGVASMMSGSGIPFSSLSGRFTYTEDGVALENLMASGESLGITASGTVDLDHDTLDLNGAIAPAHLVNSALGKVPVLGSLLMGGEGQSLFAANYELSGPSGNPGVSVNPLSAIAPGFLRRLFRPFSAGSEGLPPQPPP
ncbi:MAG: AsmA-like C-terminal domain-containing protein, partial [Stellaceae bacterium]